MKRIALIIIISGCAPSITSTNRIIEREGIRRVNCVAVFPFENSSSYPDAGFLVSEGVAGYMKKTRKGVMAPSEVRAFLEKRGIFMPYEMDRNMALAIGRLMGASGILHGKVKEFLVGERGWEEPRISFSVQLFDIRGKKLFEGEGSVNVEFYNGVPVFAFSELIDRASEKVLTELLSDLPLKRFPCTWRKVALKKPKEARPPGKVEEVKILKGPEEIFIERLKKGEKLVLETLTYEKDAHIPKGDLDPVLWLGKFLKENPEVSISLTGHSSPDEKNPMLSLLRALHIAKALYKNFNLQEGRIKVRGAGSSEPVDPQNPEKNRRVEVSLSR